MTNTRESILTTALRLFARDGYEAVSVSMIAGELHMTKGALYNHYKNKRDIFDSILHRMETMDAERANTYGVPDGPLSESPEAYRATALEQIRAYTKAQFRYWTEEPFSADFRRLLTLEQYRNPEMSALYQQYLAGGPLGYLADLFAEITGEPSRGMPLALTFYGPMFLLYSVYDTPGSEAQATALLDAHVDEFLNCLSPERTLKASDMHHEISPESTLPDA